jgi:Ca2+-binding RTX toxin-like protein
MPNSMMRDDFGPAWSGAETGMVRRFLPEATSFGGSDSYPICGCCGRYHALFDDGTSPLGFLNGDDRGGTGSNGKASLSITGAGAQLTRSNTSWATGLGQPATVDFAFRSTAPATMPTDTAGFSRFTELQISVTLLALQSWSDVANIVFNRVSDLDGYSDNATMLFGNYSSGQSGAAAFAYLPGNRLTSSASGDIWINSSLSYNATPVALGYGFQVLTHEIGHAIGLSHPAAYNAAPGQSLSYSANGGYYEDTRQYSVMSYFSETNTGGSFGGRFSAVPLLDDIAAAQRLYGANMTTRTGDTVYGFNSNAGRSWFQASTEGTALIFAVWDAGGNDTFDFSGYAQNQVIDLRQGAFSNVGALIGNVAIALGAVIENAIGGNGNDTLIGNAGDNVLTGNGGNDTIDGGLGVDTVVYLGQRSAYTVTWNGRFGTVTGPDGTDTLTNVEFIRFADQTIAAAPTGGLIVSGDITDNVMTGSSFADQLNGGGGNDTINAGGGDDTLNGGVGADTLNGEAGNDVLIGGLGNDVLNGGAGVDTVDYGAATGGVTVNLAAGTATGADGNDTLTSIEQVRGSVHADTLTGSAGADRLDGNGGNDVIRAGAGDDVLIAGAGAATGGAPDVIKGSNIVNGGFAQAVSLDSGFDLLPSSAIANSTTIPHATVVGTSHGGIEYYAFTVTAGSTITLDIDGASFDSTLRLFGPNQASLAFNDDANPDGGNDTDSQLTFTATQSGVYYVAVARWQSGTGTDVVSDAPPAGATYTLHVSVANHPVVPLTIVGSSLFGEAGNDTLMGGSAADTLNGGAGNDTLVGGDGIDTAVYSGGRREYVATSTSVSGASDGADTLSGVEILKFVDGTLNFDPNSALAQTMRLYSTALGRSPDQGGLEANALALNSIGLEALAGIFVNSPEFQARFGSLNNQQFIEQLYVLALGRQGDAAGIQSWVNVLNGGASRGSIVISFSESAEHRARTADIVNQGLWMSDPEALVIARLYDATLDRLPDPVGLASWVAAYESGTPLITITNAFIGSAEFQARYGALSNQAFIEQLYRFCLDREGDPAGIQSWVNLLNNGTSRASVVIGFSESPEHIALTAPLWSGGIRFAGQAAPDEPQGKSSHKPLVLPVADDVGLNHDGPDVLPAVFDGQKRSVLVSDDFIWIEGGSAVVADVGPALEHTTLGRVHWLSARQMAQDVSVEPMLTLDGDDYGYPKSNTDHDWY